MSSKTFFETNSNKQNNIYNNDSPNNYIKKILDIFKYEDLVDTKNRSVTSINQGLCQSNNKDGISDGSFQYIPFRFAMHCKDNDIQIKMTPISVINVFTVITSIIVLIAKQDSRDNIERLLATIIGLNLSLYLLRYIFKRNNILSNINIYLIKLYYKVTFKKTILLVILLLICTFYVSIVILFGFLADKIDSLIIKSILSVLIIVIVVKILITAGFYPFLVSLDDSNNLKSKSLDFFRKNDDEYFTEQQNCTADFFKSFINENNKCIKNGNIRSEYNIQNIEFIKFIINLYIFFNNMLKFNLGEFKATPFIIILLYILLSLLGTPIYILAGTITTIYVFFNFIYSFFVYPIFSVNPVFIKILQERGILLTLIFCALVILSIQKAYIFGDNTETIVKVMITVFSFILIFHIYKIINPK
tara:strand:+ start:10638 stop:11888 length:1251 start_codon:yes stop_codon:yes gene_type:complete